MPAPPNDDLATWLAARKARIEEALERSIPPLGTMPPTLHEAMRYTVFSGGKRLRGILTIAAGELFRKTGPAFDAMGAAVEMVHASSLILDDLPCMDDATLRRGKPALHRAVGEANAILAAVALLNGAFDVLARAPGLRERARREIVGHLAHAIGSDGLIGGQVVDLESVGRPVDLEQLEYIHSHKTGALFIAAAQAGARAAGARPADQEALLRYAKNLGLAFQITDDLLDFAGPETTGKDRGQDAGHTTFVDLCGIEGARTLVDELLGASVEALAPFGRRAGRLRELAELVRGRDR